MRKMSEYDPKALPYVFYGESNRRGIFMRLESSEETRDKDKESFTVMRFPGTYACIADDGSIQTRHDVAQKIWDEIQEEEARDGEKAYKIRTLFRIISIVFLIGMWVAIFFNEYLPSLCLSIFWIFHGLSYIPHLVLANWKALKGDKEIKQTFRFHAAEHAAINAYYDLKRVPTLEEIKEYSNFSYRCGITRAIRPAWIMIGIGLCRLAPGLWFVPLSLIFMILSFFAAKKRFYFTEVVYLSEPTDFEYEVAIKAMTYAVQAKEEIERIKADFLENLENACISFEFYGEGEKNPIFCFQIGNPDDLEDE